MQTYLALLRGINVSGQKLLKMEDLRKLMEDTGFGNVKTYIQSGNIIFDSNEIPMDKVAEKIKNSILEKYGFDVSILILTSNDLAKAIKSNPFTKEKDVNLKQVYVTYLSDKAKEVNLEKLDLASFAPDETVLIDKAIYIKFSDSASNSRLSNNLIERKLQVTATTRNWNTTLKLMELLNERKIS